MLAQHIAVDLYGVDQDLLRSPDRLLLIMQDAIAAAAQQLTHSTDPVSSCSGVLMTPWSCLWWRSWPEHQMISIDYRCYADAVDALQAVELITEQLEPSFGDHQLLERCRFAEVAPNRSPEPEDEPRPRLVCLDGDVK